MRTNLHRIWLPATLALTAQVATAQWVEVGYSVTQNFGLEQEWPGIEIVAHQQYTNVPVAILNWFKCLGHETQEPLWRMLFSDICNNTWFFQDQWSGSWPTNGEVVYVEQYCTRVGSNTFEYGESYAARTVDERVTDNVDVEFHSN